MMFSPMPTSLEEAKREILSWREMHRQQVAEVKQLRQDAKRYRWLRAQQWQDNKLGVVLRPKDNAVLGCFIPSKELLDGAIDRYMSGKNDATQGGQQP